METKIPEKNTQISQPADRRVDRTRLIALIEIVGFLGVLVLSAYLRLVNVGVNPGWYSDEGTYLDIARHLMNGDVRYLAIEGSILLFGRPPLFSYLLAGFSQVFGYDIVILRTITGVLGVVSTGLIFIVTRRIGGPEKRWLALLSAFIFAIYPTAVIYSRIGFSYNLLTPLMLVACLGFWGYIKSHRRLGLFVAVLSIGIGMSSDLMMFTFLVSAVIIIIAVRPKDLIWSLPLLALPFLLGAAWMFRINPYAFLYDLRFTGTRLAEVPFIAQIPFLLVNFTVLLQFDLWLGLGIVGLFLLKPTRWSRLALLMFLLPLISLMRTVGLTGLGFYYLSPLLPFVAIGLAALIYRGIPFVARYTRSALIDYFHRLGWGGNNPQTAWLKTRALAVGVSVALFFLVLGPLMVNAVLVSIQVNGRMATNIDQVLIDAASARSVAKFVNNELEPGEHVIASPAIAWQIEGNVADFQMALAIAGEPTQHLPETLPHDRYVFDPSLEKSRMVVVDKIWLNWAAYTIPGVADMLDVVRGWPLIFSAGEITVYGNPGI